ncbi:MAG: catalase [Lachnospiraceae bacterium]|nr:catalase [Lachnospiraceae bacterium]
MNWWKHLKTINHHKRLVMKYCFKLGMYKQGLLHDLSKYGPTEFLVGVKYYQGDRSPNNAEREDKGYTSAWLHHKGRNKHHLEYWIDYDMEKGCMTGCKMPVKYVVEMFCDRIAASRNYNGDKYTDRFPLDYYNKGKSKYMLHEESAALLEKLLTMLAEEGEEKTFAYIRKEILTKEVRKEKI